MEILDLVQKYINTDVQTVINEMCSDGYAPQLIHDTVQLLKLKGTVDELKKNPDEWIRKYQVETDDPLTLSQVHNLLRLSPGSFDEEFYKEFTETGYFPEKFLLNYSYSYHSDGILRLTISLSEEQEVLLQNRIASYETMSKPNLFIMIGIPASGKSTLSENMNSLAFCLPLDDWRQFYFNNNIAIGLRHNILPEYNELIKKVLTQGKNVILDGIFTSHKYRNHAISKYSELSNITLIYMDIPLKQCLYRNEHRPYTVLPAEIEKMYKELEPPTLGADAADAIITNHYDETSKSYTVSVQCKESMDKDLIDMVTVAINTLNMQQQILSYVHQYGRMDLQTVINEMYENHCSPRLIHDTVQLLKLKDTVDLLLSNTKQWIIKYQIETDDPCTLTQVHRLIDNSSLSTEDKQKCYDNISNYAYFPDEFYVTYATEKIEHERHKRINVNKEIIYQPGDIKLYCKTPEHMIQTLKQKLKTIKSTSEPITYIMVGIQGSGKSTLSKHLEEQGIGLRFSTDEWDKEFWNCENFIGIEGDSHAEMNAYIEKSLSDGYSVVIDSLQIMERQREYLINRSQQYGKVVLIYMDTSIEECIRRSIVREGKNGISEDKLKNLIENTYKSMEIPTLTEGVDAIITNCYDETSKSYTVSIETRNEAFKEELQGIVETIEVVNGRNKLINTEDRMNEIKTILNQSAPIIQKEI